ncbi:MAG: 3'(2'),5'-bisphosphate nucleotidase CysQ [Bacilli bacterium]|nr:3'(2'),5'-bisphosphate nucleotidase CysQ [Bacilli bacterium]
MFQRELEEMLKVAAEASENIMKYYENGFHAEMKEDNSPVTEADMTTDALIKERLHYLFPNYSFLTEESNDDLKRLENDYVFIVDPVDGTKDFIAEDGEFTCNIALAYKHEVVAGVVAAPALGIMYYASKGHGAYKAKIGEKGERIRVNDKIDNLTALISIFHFSQNESKLLERHANRIIRIEKRGSSLKACAIAEGKAEVSYRLNAGTKEWDTAAFQIIVEEAGGYVLELSTMKPLTYNRVDVHNRNGYIVVNNLENILL